MKKHRSIYIDLELVEALRRLARQRNTDEDTDRYSWVTLLTEAGRELVQGTK